MVQVCNIPLVVYNAFVSFKVNDDRLLKKYTKISGKANILMNKEFDSEPVYGDNDKHIKTRTKSYGDKVNKNLINDDLHLSSSDSESDNETDNESDNETDIGSDSQ